ncbi:MAG: hypothetical protein II816_02195, partial [Elusimicrobia bacterium]|nr:hypothetical protein [Elusimicrobiota bacterium]
ELPAKINSAYNNRDSQQATPLTEVIFGKAEQPVAEQSAEQPVVQVEQPATAANCAVIAFRDIVGDPTAQLDPNKKAGDYILDTLWVAGGVAKVAQSAAIGTAETLIGTSELGELRGNLGKDYEYATVDTKDISSFSGEAVALFTYSEEKENGKKVARGHVAKVTNTADIKAVENEGYKFSGVVLANKQVIRSNTALKTIYDPNDQIMTNAMNKFSSMFDSLQQTLSTTIYGVTNPAELNDALAATLAIYGSADEMAEALGFNNINDITNKNTKVEDIVHAYSQQAGRIFAMEDVDGKDIMASIKILSVVRDMLIMVNQDSTLVELLNNAERPEDLMTQLVINKAVNRNIVASTVNDSVGTNRVDSEEFEIDVTKLQKAVTEKIVIAKEDLLKDLGGMLGKGRGAARDYMPTALMKLSDIRAVAAAA